MNADECRARADQCLAAAQYAPDRDVKRTWQQLADMWLLWSEQLEKLRIYSGATASAESGVESRLAATISKPVISGGGEAAKVADLLRSRLALDEVNDA